LAYVPGFDHDVFVSYCHGDDRPWIRSFYELLKAALREQLGVAASVWIDEEALEKSEDFRRGIPQSVGKSALLLLLPSNQYVRSSYCVDTECAAFESTIPQKRSRFDAKEFQNQLFAFRAVILPVDNNEHWDLIKGASDYTFHDGHFRLPVSTKEFETQIHSLVVDMASLLKRMRNHTTKVFLYPRDPGANVETSHSMLKSELFDNGYCVLPDRLTKIDEQLLESSLAIFLLDQGDDPRMLQLMETIAKRGQHPWVVWESPAARSTSDAKRQLFLFHVEKRLESSRRRYFDSTIRPDQLKGEIIQLLKPASRVVFSPGEKRHVSLIYDVQKPEEVDRADNIFFSWNSEFDFDLPSAGQPSRPTRSDGVLLIWGKAEEAWASDQFERLDGVPGRKGLCVFDPEKSSTVREIRARVGDRWHISEHYGAFAPAQLDPFFSPLRRAQSTGGPV